MFRLSIAVCPSSPIRSAFGSSPGGAYQNLPVVLSFSVRRKTELPWRGISSAAAGWLVVQVDPICAIFPTCLAHISPVTFPGRCLLGTAPWDVQFPGLGCSGTALLLPKGQGGTAPALPHSSSCQAFRESGQRP